MPKAVFIAAAIHLALFLFITLFKPMAFFLDDAYYSLTIAANIASGEGITYGGFPTNGFQPLYAFLMAPVFALLGSDRMLCLRIALVFCGLCSAASLFFLFRIANRFAGKSAAIIAVFLGAFSVNLLSHLASGLETSLHALLFLIFVDYYTLHRNKMNLRRSMTIGLLLGALALARLDACFVFIAVALDRFWLGRKIPAVAVKENFIIFIPAMLVLLPWFAWNAATFGTIAQSSGAFHHWRGLETQGISYKLPGFLGIAALKLASLALKLPMEPLTGYRALILGPADFILGTEKLHRNFLVQLWEKSPLIALIFAVLIIGAIYVLVRFGKRGISRLRDIKPLGWVIVALAGAALYYPLYQINYSMRHFCAYSLLLAVPIAAFIAGALGLKRDGTPWNRKSTAVLIGLLMIIIFRCGPFDPRLPAGNPYGFERIKEIRLMVPAGSSIGYTDCGFYGYFMPDHTVVNLDGILNYQALDAIKGNTLSRYLVDKKVGYVLALDNLENEYRRQFQTDMLGVLTAINGSDFIYRVSPSSN